MGKAKRAASRRSKGRGSAIVTLATWLALPLAGALFLRSGLWERWQNTQKPHDAKPWRRSAGLKRPPDLTDESRRAVDALKRPPEPYDIRAASAAAEPSTDVEEAVAVSVAASGATAEAEVSASSGSTADAEATPPASFEGSDDPDCIDQDANCAGWAGAGECEANPGFMIVKCARACRTCHLLDYKKRCMIDESAPIAVPNGTISATFARALEEFGHLEPTLLHEDPPILQFESFLSAAEADAFIHEGREKGFTRSEDAGALRRDGTTTPITSRHRTSFTAWCDSKSCLGNKHVQAVLERSADLMQVPIDNSEYVQVLEYDVGQYYEPHNDFISGQLQLPCGPRVYTLFMYLSDVEEGGETEFTKLKISVTPKKGRAVLWPSVLDSDTFARDWRMMHQAKPVLKGKKYGANLWIHQRDFKKAHKLGCSG